LAGLRRSRVDPLHRKIYVTEQLVELAGGKTLFKSPKTDSGRTVDVPAELVPILEDHLTRYVATETDALVFSSPEGHPLRLTKFRPRWANACQSAGVTGLRFHDLRGSGATWAAVAGATLPELMHRLGHRTHTAALRYQHATDEATARSPTAWARCCGRMWRQTIPAPTWSRSRLVESRYSTQVPRTPPAIADPKRESGISPRQTGCRRGDLNPHALAGTSPSSWRVCLFRHSDGRATEISARRA
jgi:hypothetical protein